MKIKQEHKTELSNLIDKELNRISAESIRQGYESIKNDPRVHSSQKRLVWDLFYCIPQEPRHKLVVAMYDYMNDDNITSALNSVIIPKLKSLGIGI